MSEYRAMLGWYNGKIQVFRYGTNGVVEMRVKGGWGRFDRPPGFRFTEDPIPIAGTFQVTGGEHSPVPTITAPFNIPAPEEGENCYDALVRVYEPIIKDRQNELGEMRAKLMFVKSIADEARRLGHE